VLIKNMAMCTDRDVVIRIVHTAWWGSIKLRLLMRPRDAVTGFTLQNNNNSDLKSDDIPGSGAAQIMITSIVRKHVRR
jgi:hypothetical protein